MASTNNLNSGAPVIAPGAQVAILIGSDSDWPVMKECLETLRLFDVRAAVEVLSAHRTPAAAAQYALSAEAAGVQVLICAAGGAAHLAGAIAAQTALPVLGVPLPSPHLGGLDSLYSTVQMPAGVPVATFAIGSPGAVNAALFAVQILARGDAALHARFVDYKRGLARKVAEKNAALQAKLG